MKTVIYAKDIKAMNLTEEEKFVVECWANDYKRNSHFKSLQFYFNLGMDNSHDEDTKSAWAKFLDWNVKDYCKKHGWSTSLSDFCWHMAEKYTVSYCGVKRIIKGQAYTNSHIFVADTFGQDFLQYNK